MSIDLWPEPDLGMILLQPVDESRHEVDGESTTDEGWILRPLSVMTRWGLTEHLPPSPVDLELRFEQGVDPTPAQPEPTMQNARTDYPWVHVNAWCEGSEVYSARRRIQELYGPALHAIIEAVAPGRSWTYTIVHPPAEERMTFSRVAPLPTARRGKAASVVTVEPVRIQHAGRTRKLLLTAAAIERSLGELLRAMEEQTGQLTQRLVILRDGAREQRAAPVVEGSVEVDLRRPRNVPFSIRRADEPDAPVLDLTSSGIDADRLDRVNVLLSAEIVHRLQHSLPLSGRMEEGGFLAGTVFRAGPDDARHLVAVNRVLVAEHSGASSVHFTFTSDSFQAMTKALAVDGAHDRLVGWWHTHPWVVGATLGPSSADIELHRSTFQQPWQVALLIDLDSTGRRGIRFYRSTKDSIQECPVWIGDDSGRYSPTRLAMGQG